MRTTILLSCALLSCAGGMAFAADMDPGKTGDIAITDVHKAETAKADQKFINKAVAGGLLEIKASRLALTQQNLPQNVKDAAQMMIDDHTKCDEALSRIASAKDYDVPSTLDKDGVRKLEKLEEENGKGLDFLKAYDSFLVKTHRDAISLFEDTAKDSKDPDLKDFAVNTLPTLHKHLDTASQLPYAKEENEWWKFW